MLGLKLTSEMKRACWTALRRSAARQIDVMMIISTLCYKASDASGWRSKLSHPGFLPVLHPLGWRGGRFGRAVAACWQVCDLLAGRPSDVCRRTCSLVGDLQSRSNPGLFVRRNVPAVCDQISTAQLAEVLVPRQLAHLTHARAAVKRTLPASPASLLRQIKASFN